LRDGHARARPSPLEVEFDRPLRVHLREHGDQRTTHNKVGPGHICHSDYGAVRFAQYSADGAAAGISESMRAMAQDFAAAGIEVDLLDDLLLARWQKLVWNVPMSGLSVVLDTDTGALMTDSHTRALAEDIMREVMAGARSCGRHIDDGDVAGDRTRRRTGRDDHRQLNRPGFLGGS